MLNVKAIRKQFPILQKQSPNGQPLIYLDSAATALKPLPVIKSVENTLSSSTANIHRAVHFLGDEATQRYEDVREIVADFINAESNEIVFVRNTTEALNLVANYYNKQNKRIISSFAEHHSNYLPWQNNTHRLSLSSDGEINVEELEKELSKGDVALVSLSSCSNVTGNTIDLKAIARLVHQYEAKLLIDAAQSISHTSIDVTDIDCDYLAFSGHKIGAPTGVGVLFGKADLLENMPCFLQGGSTIEEVTKTEVKGKNAPWKFEAGTPSIESVIALGVAINYLLDIGMENIHQHFIKLSKFTKSQLTKKLPEAVILGDSSENSIGPYCFYIRGVSSHMIARGLSDRYGICIRSGFHCAQPLHQSLSSPPTLRISFWIYNNEDEIEQAIDGIVQLINIHQRK